MKAFDAEEISRLKLFVKSPLFNDGSRPQRVQALVEHLSKCHPDFEGIEVEKEQVFKQVFTGETFNTSKLEKVASESLKLVRKFITFCCPEEALVEHRHWLAQAQFFRQRGLDTDFRHAVEQLEKIHEEMPFHEQEYFFRQFSLEAEQVQHMVKRNNRKTDINIPGAIEYLDIAYIITKMEYCSYLLTRSAQTSLDSPQSFTLLDEVLNAAQKQYLHVPAVAAYYYAALMLLRRETVEGEAYQQLRQVLRAHANQFSPVKLNVLHAHLRNHIAAHYNRGKTELLPELLSLYKEHAATGTLLQGGQILPSTLQTAVNVALKLGDHTWAMDFLHQHRHRIAGADDMEAVFQFNLANYHFHKGDFQFVENCLQSFQFRDMFYKTAARRLELKLLYETDSPLLFSRLDAFKTFIHELKQQLPPDTIAPNNNFTDLMRQILSPKTFRNAPRIDMLIEKLKAQKAVAEREWLMGKLVGLLEKA